MNRQAHLIFLLIIFAMVYSSCEKSEFDQSRSKVKDFFERENDSTENRTFVYGTLWNSGENLPISAVEVSLFTADTEYTAISDAQGKFTFDVLIGAEDYAMLGIRNSAFIHDTVLSQIGKTYPELQDRYRDGIQKSYKVWNHDIRYLRTESRRFRLYETMIPLIGGALMFKGEAYVYGNLGEQLEKMNVTLLPCPVKGLRNDMNFQMQRKGKLKINFELANPTGALTWLITIDGIKTRPFSTPYFFDYLTFRPFQDYRNTIEIDDIPFNENHEITYSIRETSFGPIIKGGTIQINFQGNANPERIETILVP
jgi:hypothetical protein